MAMESSIEDKQLDDDYILDGMETSEADVQTASTTEQLMAVIDRLRQENAALMTANAELMKQAKAHREEEEEEEEGGGDEEYEDSWTESGLFSPKAPQQSPNQRMELSNDGTQSHRRVLEILRKQAREMKEIRELAESRTRSTISYITDLEHQVGDLSLQLLHKEKSDDEIKIIKERVKKLETLALEYVPLGRQAILMGIDECKTEVLAFQKRQKQRWKKERLNRKDMENQVWKGT